MAMWEVNGWVRWYHNLSLRLSKSKLMARSVPDQRTDICRSRDQGQTYRQVHCSNYWKQDEIRRSDPTQCSTSSVLYRICLSCDTEVRVHTSNKCCYRSCPKGGCTAVRLHIQHSIQTRHPDNRLADSTHVLAREASLCHIFPPCNNAGKVSL